MCNHIVLDRDDLLPVATMKLQKVGMFVNGIACFVKVWPLIKRELPLNAMM